ncbi:MAG: DUF72 domain-containing protein [Myxococcota bacterium]
MEFLVGTSGYSYKEWREVFYPKELKASEYLSHYARHLPAVEINNTFYRMPKTSVVAKWREEVGDSFRFSVKASQRITHHKRLKDATEPLAFLERSLAELDSRLGVVLFQLPPSFRCDVDRLNAFLADMPAWPVAFEFRHPSWFTDEVFDRLRECNAACVINDDGASAPLDPAASFGYLRLRNAEYSDGELDEWARRIRDTQWDRAFVFFKHEEAGAGPVLAQRLLDRLQA